MRPSGIWSTQEPDGTWWDLVGLGGMVGTGTPKLLMGLGGT